jgi:AraC-like DNA-binding protein
MYQASLRKLEAQARRLEGQDFLVAHLEQVLETAGDAGLPLEQAARRVHLSRRTLNRRLAELGTSYRAVLEAHLRARADALLRDPNLTVSDVASRLGYDDTANFGRACRRWFGMPPGRVRKESVRRG